LICSVDDSQHLRTLARLSRLIASPRFLDALRETETAAEVVSTVKNFEEQLSANQTAG
jgi:PTS system nitrogen regulatory IIA component